jgi:hypothetical protein
MVLSLFPAELATGFIPDLDLYGSDIAGFACSATRLELRPLTQLEDGQCLVAKTFRQTHPQYIPILDLVSPSQTPDLAARFEWLEELRIALAELFPLVIAAKARA